MQTYWAGNKKIQHWGFFIIKTVVLGSVGIVIVAVGKETWGSLIRMLWSAGSLISHCPAGCHFPWMISLLGLLCVYELGLLIGLIKSPRGFWLNFLLIFWGILGFVILYDTWQYSWQPGLYPSGDSGFSYGKQIVGGMIVWAWSAMGAFQVFLPVNLRKYVISLHTGILGLVILSGALMSLFS